MKSLFLEAIAYLGKKGVTYADIRYVDTVDELISVEDMRVDGVSRSHDRGFGIRVLDRGAWGFASDWRIGPQSVIAACDLAIAFAHASSSVTSDRVSIEPGEAAKGIFYSPCEIDPFSVKLDNKLDYLLWACRVMKEHKNVMHGICKLNFRRIDKSFFNTAGSDIRQVFTESGGYIECIAILGDEVQRRSYPNSHGSNIARAGYEYVKEMDLVGGAEKARDEAVSLLRAKPCPESVTSVVIGGSQLALQIHESCGHPAELDRVLGDEVSYAGSSFLTPDKLDKYRYGSDIVNIYADATIPSSIGSFFYDDEGIKAGRFDIVKDGIFTGYLSSMESASHIGALSTGCMRSESWNLPPLVRMTNINLKPGKGSLAEIIGDVKDGVLLDTNKSWSIDTMRLNFQFGCEIAWRIKDGRLTEPYKNPVYSGITPEFWKNLTAISGPEEWRVWGIPNCGKGEPVQTMRVGHGASPARFDGISIGGLR